MEPKIETQFITYKQLREDSFKIPNDRLGIAAYVLTPSRKKALSTCPFIRDPENTCAIQLSIVDGIVGGRTTLFTERVMLDGELFDCGSGSSLEVAEPYRHMALGIDLMMRNVNKNQFKISSGISEMALPLYKKLRYHVLEFPRIMLIRNSKSILDSKHLGFFSGIVNIPIKVFNNFIIKKSERIAKRFRIEKVTKVPEWVDEMTIREGHKYKEFHNHEWLQWNLDNNFRGLPQDKQSFFCIFKNCEPLGFYMTKERFRETAGGSLHNVLIGSVVEWGSKDENVLSEYDILLLSLKNFSTKVDIIETATANKATVQKAKYLGFMTHGFAHIAFKDMKRNYKDASDIHLWRVRYGYADVILT